MHTQVMETIRSFPPMLPTTAESIMRTAYRVDHGLIAPNEVGKPFATVKYSPKEDTVEGSLRFSYIRKFYHFKIGELFNTDLDGFFALPYDDANFLCEIAASHQHRFNRVANSIEQDLEKDLSKPSLKP